MNAVRKPLQLAFDRIVRLSRQLCVETVMTADLVTVDDTQRVEDVRRLLRSHSFDQAPITRDGEIVGLLPIERLDRTAPE